MTKTNWRIVKAIILSVIFTLMLFSKGSVVLAQVNCNQCHSTMGIELKSSVHSTISCTSCHQDVTAYPHPQGVAVDKKESVALCSTCHTGPVTDSYKESFHGKAIHLGSQRSASCVDCHSAHNVLSQDHPSSQVAKANIPQTCAACHGNPSPGFAQGTEHFQLTAMGPGKPMYYTAKFFVWLTLIVMTLLVIHMEMQLYRELRIILQNRKKR